MLKKVPNRSRGDNEYITCKYVGMILKYTSDQGNV